MKQVNLKKVILPNLPYFLLGLYATKLGQAWRLAPGISLADKLLRIMDGLVLAFQSAAPSFHPIDLLVGIACGAGPPAVRSVHRHSLIGLHGQAIAGTPLPPPGGGGPGLLKQSACGNPLAGKERTIHRFFDRRHH